MTRFRLVEFLSAIGIAAAIHVDWHLARHVHARLSFGLAWHWVLAVPVFAAMTWVITRVSLDRAVLRSGLAILLGILLGQIAEPLLTAFYSVPMVALAPLFIAWLGLGFASKFAIILLVTVFPIIITTEVGLRSTDKVYLDAAKSFNATPLQTFTTVQFPFALPYIIGGVRVAFARALVGAVVAEFFGAFAGYGYAILAAGQNFNTARLLGYVVLLAVLGMLGSIVLRWLERKMTPWKEEG